MRVIADVSLIGSLLPIDSWDGNLFAGANIKPGPRQVLDQLGARRVRIAKVVGGWGVGGAT